MRLSADRSSPFYDEDKVSRATVFVDGEELKACVEADEEAGTAKAIKLNSAGLPVREGYELVTYDVTGKVEIRIRE